MTPCTFHGDREAPFVDSLDEIPVCVACAQLMASNERGLAWTVLATGQTVNYPSSSYARASSLI